jgi:hypothetical protein
MAWWNSKPTRSGPIPDNLPLVGKLSEFGGPRAAVQYRVHVKTMDGKEFYEADPEFMGAIIAWRKYQRDLEYYVYIGLPVAVTFDPGRNEYVETVPDTLLHWHKIDSRDWFEEYEKRRKAELEARKAAFLEKRRQELLTQAQGGVDFGGGDLINKETLESIKPMEKAKPVKNKPVKAKTDKTPPAPEKPAAALPSEPEKADNPRRRKRYFGAPIACPYCRPTRYMHYGFDQNSGLFIFTCPKCRRSTALAPGKENNPHSLNRQELEASVGHVWDISTAAHQFDFLAFYGRRAVVKDRTSGLKGTIEIQDKPRLFFNFRPYMKGLTNPRKPKSIKFEMSCHKCGKKVLPADFRTGDELRIFMVTGICQDCQDVDKLVHLQRDNLSGQAVHFLEDVVSGPACNSPTGDYYKCSRDIKQVTCQKCLRYLYRQGEFKG